MAESADARDSKSRGINFPCGFKSHLRYLEQKDLRQFDVSPFFIDGDRVIGEILIADPHCLCLRRFDEFLQLSIENPARLKIHCRPDRLLPLCWHSLNLTTQPGSLDRYCSAYFAYSSCFVSGTFVITVKPLNYTPAATTSPISLRPFRKATLRLPRLWKISVSTSQRYIAA